MTIFRRSSWVVIVAMMMLASGVLADSPLASAADSSSTTSSTSASTTTVPGAPSSTTITGPAGGATAPESSNPGVYVTDIPAFGDSMVQVATGIPLFVGVGPAPGVQATEISSFDEFMTKVPASSSSLSNAVLQFYDNGGSVAFVQGVADASATSIIGAFSGPIQPEVDLLVSVDLSALPTSEWLGAAVAMGRAATSNLAVALVDPPQTVVAEAGADPTSLVALGADLRSLSGPAAGSMFLFASGVVTDEGATIPVSPLYAGAIASTDSNDGFWDTPGGYSHPLRAVRPQTVSTNTQIGTLVPAGLVPISYVPGHGTVVMSDRLLSAGPGDYITSKRTLDTVRSTITVGLRSFVFDANNGQTWQAVTQSVSGYLNGLWNQGGLFGSTASDAFTVACGLGSTMTGDDILNGELVVDVGLAIVEPGEFIPLSIQQQMGS